MKRQTWPEFLTATTTGKANSEMAGFYSIRRLSLRLLLIDLGQVAEMDMAIDGVVSAIEYGYNLDCVTG
jgi:hypothetical protein